MCSARILIDSCKLSIALLFVLSGKSHAQSNGVLKKTDQASSGYTLIAPLGSTETRLIDIDGKVVHRWQSDVRPGNSVYLLNDGSLLRTGKVTDNPVFPVGGGSGGRVQRISWDGKLLWDFQYASDSYFQHHDVEPMPNGNVLLIAWEKKTVSEAVAAGRDPNLIGSDRRGGGERMLWPETIVEIKPTGSNDGEVVWKWSLWDHLVQDFDASKANYGSPDKHPELVDLNFTRNSNPDWIHMNSVSYNAALDQIILSARWFNEVWIIDHSTTTAEAASHAGGKYGKGGDLLYRWGNPYAHFAGFPEEQRLFAQHDAHWIPNGLPGAGNLMVFNNGDRQLRPVSTVDEWKPPAGSDGSYDLSSGRFGPTDFTWSYQGEFHSDRISGAQRMPNGNTLICSGGDGHVLEVTKDKKVVWEYRLPNDRRLRDADNGASRQGPGPPTGAGGPGGRGGGGGLFRAPRYFADHPAFKGKQL